MSTGVVCSSRDERNVATIFDARVIRLIRIGTSLVVPCSSFTQTHTLPLISAAAQQPSRARDESTICSIGLLARTQPRQSIRHVRSRDDVERHVCIGACHRCSSDLDRGTIRTLAVSIWEHTPYTCTSSSLSSVKSRAAVGRRVCGERRSASVSQESLQTTCQTLYSVSLGPHSHSLGSRLHAVAMVIGRRSSRPTDPAVGIWQAAPRSMDSAIAHRMYQSSLLHTYRRMGTASSSLQSCSCSLMRCAVVGRNSDMARWV